MTTRTWPINRHMDLHFMDRAASGSVRSRIPWPVRVTANVDYASGAEGLEVSCDVLDAQGGRVAGARVYLRTTPGDFEPIRLMEEDGRYVCRIPYGALPKMYDASSARYEPLSGALRLVVQAEREDAQGGCLVTAYIS